MSAPEPVVGLGMPVHNGERFLERTLESILAQTFADFELVICDNASSDKTEQICRSYAARDSRIRYYRNAENIGAHPNYNRAFELARGRYFKFVPHDDLLAPQYLEACVQALDENPKAALCQAQLDFIDADDVQLGVCRSDLHGAQAARPSQRFSAAILTAHNCYDMMGLFHRATYARTARLASFHGSDRALVAELALLGPFLQIPRPLLRVRDHDGRYTRSHVDPRTRASWHDTRLTGRITFPTWRLYATYAGFLRRHSLPPREKARSLLAMAAWWFVNWNTARMMVDVIAAFLPGVVRTAERFKQSFSPAPGIDHLLKVRRDG